MKKESPVKKYLLIAMLISAMMSVAVIGQDPPNNPATPPADPLVAAKQEVVDAASDVRNSYAQLSATLSAIKSRIAESKGTVLTSRLHDVMAIDARNFTTQMREFADNNVEFAYKRVVYTSAVAAHRTSQQPATIEESIKLTEEATAATMWATNLAESLPRANNQEWEEVLKQLMVLLDKKDEAPPEKNKQK